MKPNTVSKAPTPPSAIFLLLLCGAAAVLLATLKVDALPDAPVPTQTCPPVFAENFDGVIAPALPAGWVATNTVVGTPFWITSTTTPDTPPNDASVDDPAMVNDKRLDTPDIAITSASAQVSFRNNFNLESTFDGGVLELSSLSINNGQFTDITDPAVGGSFVTGGYTATISTAFQSPIAGRLAWSGNSGGYIDTVANLGPRVAGQTIKLRFRMGSDASVAGIGWLVDTITVTDGPCPTPTPTPGSTPAITSPLAASCLLGQQFTYQFEAIGADGLDVSNLPQGLRFDSFLSAIVGTPASGGVFPVGLIASNAAGANTATLTITVQAPPPAGPVIASSTSATGRVGQPFNFRVMTIHGSPAARLTVTGLPAGLSVDSVTGVISGISTAAGSTAVTLTVTDGSFVTTALLQLTFTSDSARPVILSPDTALLTVGHPFSYTINAPSSGDATLFTLLGALPAGLGFDAAAGTISGTPQRSTGGGGGDQSDAVDLTGGTLLASVQLFGTNSHGTGTFQLLFLAAPSGLVNISTRLLVGTENNVLIGGFIVTGNAPKVVIVRAIGPSLTAAGIPGALQDPTLELHDSAHPNIVVINDNWKDTQEQIIRDTGIAPLDDRESAIVAGLDPGNYTAIVSGKANTTGVALVEVYDLGTASLDASSSARLAQISTRGTVLTGSNVMIGGFIINGAPSRVIVRAIGPELNGVVPGALQDTFLELRDGVGSLVASNDDWRSTQQQEIIDTGVPPTDDRESAIVANLNPGNYTGIVSGKNNTTGVALVEVYALP